MANVRVETDELKKIGQDVQNICNNIGKSYSTIRDLDINLDSFKSFQAALANKNEIFNDHSDIFKTRITECAEELEKTDDLIGSKATPPPVSTDTSDSTVDGAKLTSVSNYSLSRNLDYTFDQSNYNISAEELYAKAAKIRNSNLPINIKIVNAAKLFHEYTMTWRYTDNAENLIYERGYEATIEDPNKQLCCATGVSDVLYLAGANTTDEMRVEGGAFNPHWQHNIERLASKMNWEIIPTSNLSEIQPGDIMMTSRNSDGTYGHVEIYAGNNYVYNWGNTTDIQAETAKYKTPAQYQAEGAYAIRVVEKQTI